MIKITRVEMGCNHLFTRRMLFAVIFWTMLISSSLFAEGGAVLWKLSVAVHKRQGDLQWGYCLAPILPIVMSHHENYDGSGYPDGLQAENIPLGARILGLADAFDALTSSRSYRENFSPEKALEILNTEAVKGLWDREVLAVLSSLIRRSGA